MISGFFNGQSVTAEDFATAFGGVMTNGVLADTQDALKVLPAGNMDVAINTGYCWAEGHFGNNEATTSLTIDNADGVLNRIDRVIARLNRTLNIVQLLIIKGTLSATPTPPALVRDGTYFDLCLAEIKVDKGTTTITEELITDTRNDATLCGAVTLRSAFNFALEGKADKSVVKEIAHQIGEVTMFAGTSAPTKWLLCQGQTISRSTYADLFNVIGTTYGIGNGSTTFNIPNLKGKVPAGYNSDETEFDSLGKTGGEKTHTLTVNEMPKHNHTYSRNYFYEDIMYTEGYGGSERGRRTQEGITGLTGGNQSHNNLQPYITLNYMIYAGV